MENPCNNDDMELFYALTKVTIGDDNKASFWDALWADGIILKSIAPLIYAFSKWKNWNVRKAINNDAWIIQIDSSEGLSVQHL
jgi:hypothetical protein